MIKINNINSKNFKNLENNSDDILSFLSSEGIINLDDVRDKMKEQEKERLLKKHRYKIFQDKDGRWKTTIPDDTKKNGRRLIAKKELSELQDIIIKYYKDIENKDKQDQQNIISKNISLKDIYPLWIQSRKLEVNSINTVKKNDQDWKRYYLQNAIINKPMVELTVQELKDWAHQMIETYNFNKRDYYNMAIIIKQCFEYAVSSGYLAYNTWSDVKINTKKLQRVKKKENVQEIYFKEEEEKLIKYAFDMFSKNSKNITALAIPLLFVTGMRIGEVVSLKYEDLNESDNVIYVNNSETVVYELDGQGNFKYKRREIQDHTKTDAGERHIPYSSFAKEIITLIKESSEKYGYYDEGFIFCPNSRRINATAIDKKLSRYCKALNIDVKRAHKIRKTFISKLIHSQEIDIDTICRIAGHTDVKTTFMSYCYSLEQNDTINVKFNEIFKSVNKCKQV